MAGKQAGRIRQEAAAGRDANVAGGDQVIVNVGAADLREPVVPGLLPRDVPEFAGRQGELDRLTGRATSGLVVVTAIGGTAGVGKTALAVHAAHRLLPQFPDGQLYADLRGYTEGQSPAEPGDVLEVFLRSLGVRADDMPASTEEQSGLLRQLLASLRVLMLLDNARSEVQVRPLLPGTGGSLVLVTSRSVLPGLEVDERIDLDVLPVDEATALLAGLIGTRRAAAESEAVEQVAGWCGWLPLALRIAGQLLAAHPAWPVAKLAAMLSGERHRLQQLVAGDLRVRAAFEVSYRQLADMDARMFRQLGLHPGPDFDVVAAASLAAIEEGAAGLVLDRLVLAHLVTEDRSGRFGMHDLLRLFARDTCYEADEKATRDAAEARMVGHYADLARFLDSCLDPRQRQAAEQAGEPLPLMPEVLAKFETERPNLLAALGLAVDRGWDEQVGQLGDSMGESLTFLRYLGDLLTVREAALAAARRTGDTPSEGKALDNLGKSYRRLRRYDDAIGCYEKSLAIFRESADRYGEGTTLKNLGNAYRELGRFEEAIGCYEKSLAIYRESGERHGEGRTLRNLGKAYRGLGQFEETIGYYEKSLAIFQKGGDRYGEGRTLRNLGDAYRELGRFEEAIGYYEKSLAIYRESGERHGEGTTLSSLGNAYWDLQQPDQATAYWRDAAAAMRNAGDHEEAARLEHLAVNAPTRRRRWWRNN